MGIASFVFGREAFRTKIGEEIVVDCTVQLMTDLAASVTKHPIQGGSLISDHVNLEPLVLKIEGIISESPIGDIKTEVSAILTGVAAGLLGDAGSRTKVGGAGLVGSGLGAALGSKLGSKISGTSKSRDDGTYPQVAMQTLISARDERKPFLIRTFFQKGEAGKRLYENMVITQLSFPQSASDGRSLRFSLTCEKVNIVSLTVGKVDGDYVKGIQAANSASTKVDKGRQGPEDPKAKTVSGVTELTSELDDLFGGF
jgi:hypothetical protein